MNIGIIGGGASGMILASLVKSDSKCKITLLEKNNKLGKKLLLTGNGKCNFTSGDFDNLNDIYNNDFARTIYKKYDNKSFIKYVESIGVVPKCEIHKGTKYYYPNSNKATSVYYNLLDKIVDNGVYIKYNENVIDINTTNDAFAVKTENNVYKFDKIFISTGGITYKKTGSDGNIFKVLRRLGHNIIEPLPALCGFNIQDKDLKSIINVRVDATIEALCSDKIYTEKGEMQWTSFGISGIPVMNLSRKVNRSIYNGDKVELKISFCDDEDLIDKLYRRRDNLYYKNVNDFLCGFLPDEIADVIIKRSNIKCKKVSELTDIDVKNIYTNITHFQIKNIKCMDGDTAQITIGGISTDDVDVESLESKIIKNLYFLGEVLDIDGKCGGYNLQLAYSTAMIAGEGIMKNIRKE